jgi:L-ascorbate metabolism protein UlaG (beta-lactamase superfamily)
MLRITYYGHAAFQIEGGKTKILIDPFLNDNPLSPVKAKDVQAEYIVLSHGHGDHLGDTLEIAQKNNSMIIAVNELANYCAGKGARAHNMHIGGSYAFPFGRVKFTIAHHGSVTPDGVYAGNPAGIVLTLEGKNIYHAGDTALFYDMKLIGESTPLDVALIPIGDNFTMGVDDAVRAVELLNPKLTIPMHYNTWPLISGDAGAFLKRIGTKGFRGRIVKPGESVVV